MGFGNSKQDFNCMIPIDFQRLQKKWIYGLSSEGIRNTYLYSFNALTAGLRCWLGLITAILQEG